MKLTAQAIPFSGVFGGGFALHNETGAVVAQIVIMVPNPQFDREEIMKIVTPMLVETWNAHAALASPPPPSGGWKLVPVEPVQEMNAAGLMAALANRARNKQISRDVYLEVWAAMLAAAPSPATGGE